MRRVPPTLEDHGLIKIIGNIDNEMATGKTKAGSPVGLQLRRALDRGDALRLAHVAQMLSLWASFVVSIAHDWPCVAQRPARLFVDGTYNISQVCRLNGHFIFRILLLLNNVFVPILTEAAKSRSLKRRNIRM